MYPTPRNNFFEYKIPKKEIAPAGQVYLGTFLAFALFFSFFFGNLLFFLIVLITSVFIFLEKEVERYKQEKLSANRDNKQATLSSPDTLVQVLERQTYRGSSCTILKMGDGSQRHMKTSTFDPAGSVTAHAKTLIGKRVRISCWDPIHQPGRWSNEGYFRNVYATE